MTHRTALLFDLDGTLLDTALDLGACLNQLLMDEGRPPLPLSTIRPWVSLGTQGMLAGAFPERQESERERLRPPFLKLYQDRIAAETRPFPGIAELLEQLQTLNIPWGVVTNKPAMLTLPLLRALALPWYPGTVVCGDTTPHAKPHPEPLWHACRELGVSPDRCVYVGDAEKDIQAARRAGMPGLVASFGYIAPHDRIDAWGAAAIIDHPRDIGRWVGLC